MKRRFQTKAAYVLFYQRRDISSACYKRDPSSSSSTAEATVVCNGNDAPAAADKERHSVLL